MRILHLSLLLPLVGAALGRIVELPPMDDKGLPVEDKDKAVGAKAAPEIEELGTNFFERINKGYWCVFLNQSPPISAGAVYTER